jgi:hypothetical protein
MKGLMSSTSLLCLEPHRKVCPLPLLLPLPLLFSTSSFVLTSCDFFCFSFHNSPSLSSSSSFFFLSSSFSSSFSPGHIEVVSTLLAHNALVNATRSADSTTPLFFAIRSNNLPITKLLLSYNADLHSRRSDGVSILSYASMLGHQEMVQLLLDHFHSQIIPEMIEEAENVAIQYLHPQIAEILRSIRQES